jgi:hypothetical protein
VQAGDNAHAACAPIGRLEYVVESRHDGDVETWFVLRPHPDLAPQFESLGVALSPGCRVVVEARSLRPVGVLDSELPPAPLPAGFNPYFDLPST